VALGRVLVGIRLQSIAVNWLVQHQIMVFVILIVVDDGPQALAQDVLRVIWV